MIFSFRNGSFPRVYVTFEVNSVTPNKCSSYGGCDTVITGRGLYMDDIHSYDIRIGGARCVLDNSSTVTNTEISCFLGDTSKTHLVTNGGLSTGI